MIEFKARNFTLEEFITSQIAAREGIDNTPSDLVINNINWLCLKILDPLREKLGKPVIVLSGFRCIRLNEKVGGALPSQHTEGEAVDIIVPGMTAQQLFDFIIENTQLPFDQIIQEFDSWVHISYSRLQQRGNKFYAKKINGKTSYIKA